MREVRFLVTDDSKVVRAKVRMVIENRIGATDIIEATNGLEAIKALETNKIDIIISDWNMPNLNGEELLYEVRNNKEWNSIPFIMMTAHDERDYLVTAIQNGVSCYITKPFTPGELEDKIIKSWNSAANRGAERYTMMPEHELIIRSDNLTIVNAKIINISRTGAMIRLMHDDQLGLFKKYKLSLEVMVDDDIFVINPIFGTTVRLEAEDTLSTASMFCLMAISFIPSLTNKEVEEKINFLLKYLCSQSPDIINDL
jgi:two-component system, chemotaxis family, chemotaxis protein CheY